MKLANWVLCWLAACLLGAPQVYARVNTSSGASVTSSSVRDLAQIRQSGVIRVLINESRTSSGEVKSQTLGIEYQRVRAFVQALNQDSKSPRNLRLQLIPKPKDQLFEALRRGEGDLIAPGELMPKGSAGLSASTGMPASLPVVVVARKGNRQYRQLADLAGRTLTLPQGSVVPSVLESLNTRLTQTKRSTVKYEIADATLAAEDVLELVNAGLLLLTAVELPVAERWAKVLPNLRIDRHMVLDEAPMRWYVRRGASNLLARIDRFARTYQSPANRDAAFERLYRRIYKLHNIKGTVEVQRLKKVRPVLERIARQQNLDWTLLAAIAYKESTLNPNAKGSNGATGLMQVTPVAARAVGVSQFASLEGNVLASAKYLSQIRKQHFASASIPEGDRYAFMLAAYNMGPGRVVAMRAEARRRGLDPNRWYFQVERVAMEQMGLQVAHYVSAINKYRLIYARDFAR